MTAHIDTQIINLSEFYKLQLVLPDYQRPYKWTEKNIRALFDDLDYFVAGINDKNRHDERYKYRLGTIILHKDSQHYIVDGQQRSLTFYLIRHALQTLSADLKDIKIAEFKIDIPACRVTQENLRRNYDIIQRILVKSRIKPLQEYIDILLHKCEFVVVELQKISEAFQFFDSQNSRGLDLYPHDLLKAYHLREFDPQEVDFKIQAVKQWEKRNHEDVNQIFSQYLYPIRQWTKGDEAFAFTKEKINGFKGISLHQEEHSPFMQAYDILHSTVDQYNQDHFRKIDRFKLNYPFQLTQTLINGRRFFEWFSHYEDKILALMNIHPDTDWISPLLRTETSKKIWKVIHGIPLDDDKQASKYHYKGLNRAGDRYIKRILNAFLLSYYDKFGEYELSSALEIGFIWAYSVRLKKSSVYESSIENHVIKFNLFKRLDSALSPKDFLNFSLNIEIKENKATKVEGIVALFKEMKYMTDKS